MSRTGGPGDPAEDARGSIVCDGRASPGTGLNSTARTTLGAGATILLAVALETRMVGDLPKRFETADRDSAHQPVTRRPVPRRARQPHRLSGQQQGEVVFRHQQRDRLKLRGRAYRLL